MRNITTGDFELMHQHQTTAVSTVGFTAVCQCIQRGKKKKAMASHCALKPITFLNVICDLGGWGGHILIRVSKYVFIETK